MALSPIIHSLVIPVFNEKAGIDKLYSRVTKVLDSIQPESSEVIFVDDGSQDGSDLDLDACAEKDPRIRVLHFSRNFGHQAAISAGMAWAKGATVTVMDADLQDPPELIPEFIAKWKEGFEVVYAVRRTRAGETFFKLWTARFFYRLIKRLTQVNIPLDTGDFRLLDRKAVDAFLNMKERHRFVRGMVSWVGYRQTGVFYNRSERAFGESHYPFGKMIKFALDGITSFSTIPLQIATYLGIFSALLALCFGLWTLYGKFYRGSVIQGWTSVILAVLFFGGVQLLTLGVIGEYLGRIYEETKNRPLYLISRAVGFERRES